MNDQIVLLKSRVDAYGMVKSGGADNLHDDKFALLKAHIDQYTRKDGTVVQAHETSVQAAAGNNALAIAKLHSAAADHHFTQAGISENPTDAKAHADAGKMHAAAKKHFLASSQSHGAGDSDKGYEHAAEGIKYGTKAAKMSSDLGHQFTAVASAPAAKPAAAAPAAGAAGKLTHEDVEKVQGKHYSKFTRKAESWNDVHGEEPVPHHEVAHWPEFSHKEVYGHEGKTRPTDDFHPDFAAKGHQGFVLKHPSGKRAAVDTRGFNYARFAAPVGDPEQTETKPAGGTAAPAAKPAAKSSYVPPKEGEVGHEEHKKYGRYFSPGEKVKDNYGEHHEVMEHRGPQVLTTNGKWFHPTKVHKVED